MARTLRTAILLVLAFAVGVSPALGASVPGCINPADSALNQYCETIPGATGAKPPTARTPVLATSLPTGLRRQIARGTRRVLLGLPAHQPRNPVPATSNVSKTSTSSLPLWLFLALGAVAMALTAAAVGDRRRRRRAAPPGAAPA